MSSDITVIVRAQLLLNLKQQMFFRNLNFQYFGILMQAASTEIIRSQLAVQGHHYFTIPLLLNMEF